jgi:hypothetical protein
MTTPFSYAWRLNPLAARASHRPHVNIMYKSFLAFGVDGEASSTSFGSSAVTDDAGRSTSDANGRVERHTRSCRGVHVAHDVCKTSRVVAARATTIEDETRSARREMARRRCEDVMRASVRSTRARRAHTRGTMTVVENDDVDNLLNDAIPFGDTAIDFDGFDPRLLRDF